ncbi:matrixin family metalloprotease [Candidatus Blastococcus massiliensis]|uniref:matrixin family metalloprotease n=1 Tax=Candidatus Blastococcus massiliensis TaxID=1470358 RepID=UPI0012DC5611|nr:matrixin family metalloprotease [Candidatus Blastococcus massiliensis]
MLLTAEDTWSVPLPPPGMQVTQSAVGTEGHTEFIVRRTASGAIEVLFVDTSDGHADHPPADRHEADHPHADHAHHEHEASTDAVDSGAPGPYQGGAPDRCTDARWSSLGHFVYGPHVWFYNGAGAPLNVAATGLEAFTSSFDNVAAGRDGCHVESTTVLTSQVFAGETTVPPGITPSRTCQPYDGLNVAGWVRGGSGYLGLACIYSYVDAGYGPRVLDADITLNANYTWSTGPDFSASQYDVASVVAHEVGHVFGLGHAGSSAAPSQLTMSGSGVYPTSIYARYLGAGDREGLSARYGSMGVDR